MAVIASSLGAAEPQADNKTSNLSLCLPAPFTSCVPYCALFWPIIGHSN